MLLQMSAARGSEHRFLPFRVFLAFGDTCVEEMTLQR